MAADTSTPTRADRRRHRRRQASFLATVSYGRLVLPCFVADVSAGGARLKLMEPAALPKGPVAFEAARLGKVPAELVWQKGLFAGLKFTALQAPLGDAAGTAPGIAAQPAATDAPARGPGCDDQRRTDNRATPPA